MKNLFFLSSHDIGLSSLLVEQAINLEKYSNLSYSFFSGENEQEKGLRDKLTENNIKLNIINGLDSHKNFLKLVFKLVNFLKEINPDIVHVQTNWQLVIVVIAKYVTLSNFKIIYTIHGYRNNHKFQSKVAIIIIQLLLLFFTKRVYSASSFVTNKFKIVKHKIKTLFLGVENQFFEFSNSINEFKNLDKFVLFYPAAFREGKNQLSLIKIIEKIIHNDDKNIKLYLAGDGLQKKECENYVNNNNLEHNIIFLGQVARNEILDYYKKSIISIVISNVETFGHCIAEPFVLGSCVVTRRTGIALDIIKDGYNGFTFEKDDELYIILKKLLKNNEIIKMVSLNSFKDRDLFYWEKLVNDYELDLIEIFKVK